MKYHLSFYLCRKVDIRLYRKNVTTEFTPALIRLKPMMYGIKPFTTSTGTPIKRGVTTRFAITITTVQVTTPAARATTALRLLL